MKISNNYFLYLVLISVLTSVTSVWVYDRYCNPWQDLYLKEKTNSAIEVAEQDILFSDRFRDAFTSSSPTDFTKAAESSRKAVVYIKSINQLNILPNFKSKPLNTGSGVILSSDGLIVTNHHVIEGASKIEITLNDNRVFFATVIGTDPSTDLALIKIEANNLDFLAFGNSDSLRIGEWVMAVGNPFKLQSTVTAGIVSAKGRNINLLENQGIEAFIQTDAAVNPGNSGGALINTRGDLIGICTAILSNTGKYEGFSFAVPSNLAKKIIGDLREYGTVQRGWLGIEIENVDDKMATELGLKDVSGVYISSVIKDGGAYDAGMRSGDVVLSIDNMRTTSMGEFREQVARHRPGDELTLVYVRNKNKGVVKATLRNQLNTTDLVGVKSDDIFETLGISVRNLGRSENASMIAGNGVIVVSVQNRSLVASTKMEPGYIITKINNKEVTSINMLTNELKKQKGKTIIFEGFYPNISGEFPYTFEMPMY
ncbi:MAG: trypsin-like peptidase domain-containing protein [Saprospiraceae bacterium]